MRASGSLIHHVGAAAVRLDLGFDTPLLATGDAEITDRTAAIRVGLGAPYGAVTKGVFELGTLVLPESDGAASETFTQIGLGVAHPIGLGIVKAGLSVTSGFLLLDIDDSLSLSVGYGLAL